MLACKKFSDCFEMVMDCYPVGESLPTPVRRTLVKLDGGRISGTGDYGERVPEYDGVLLAMENCLDSDGSRLQFGMSTDFAIKFANRLIEIAQRVNAKSQQQEQPPIPSSTTE